MQATITTSHNLEPAMYVKRAPERKLSRPTELRLLGNCTGRERGETATTEDLGLQYWFCEKSIRKQATKMTRATMANAGELTSTVEGGWVLLLLAGMGRVSSSAALRE